jgi:hypothetical protein
LKITKNYIEVEETIYYFKNIKKIDFIEDKFTFSKIIGTTITNISFFGIIYFIMIIPIFFTINIFTIILTIIATIGIISTLIPYKTKYSIFIGINEIYKTENKIEFLKYKKEILENNSN